MKENVCVPLRTRIMRLVIVLIGILVGTNVLPGVMLRWPVLSTAESAPQEVNFERDVWPILVDRCIVCHGSEQQEGQLRLDSRAAAFEGGVSGSPFADTAEESLLIERLMSKDTDERMPLEEPSLSKRQIEVIVAWIEAGRVWPDHIGGPSPPPTRHWAYQKPVLPLVPAVEHGEGALSPIDAFIRTRLVEKGMQPTPPASPAILLRRLYLDLIGLPPPIEVVERFITNPSPQAYEQIVDRLLSSSRFGEKWAHNWLDLARYSDSNGYQADQLRDLWAYRDWTIDALNADMPYDQFTVEQLAGDLLPNATIGQKTATGFHRTPTCNIEAGVDPEENRTNQVIDRVNTTATVWLGTTLECAQCHNHKYDPFTQQDYYRLFAFFNNTPLEVENARKDGVQFDFYGPRMELPTDPQKRQEWHKIDADLQKLKEGLREAKREAMARFAAWEKQILDGNIQPSESLTKARLSELKKWLRQEPAKRTESIEEKIKQAFFDSDKKVAPLLHQLAALERTQRQLEPETTLVMLEMEFPRNTRIFKRGDFRSPRQAVSPGVPLALHPLPSQMPPDRLGLAQWLMDAENPLTARVRVNHLWTEIFGTGLVATGEDFGTQGSPPSHPALMDWLAVTFMQDGWSTKRLIKRIVTSATYQQSSQRTFAHEQRDPKNIWLARGPRFRLSAETIRDNGLAIAGMLEEKMGGPPVYPPQPEGLWHQTGRGEPVYQVAQSSDRYRRGVYVVWRRVAPYPSFVNFDAPDRTRCVVERSRTNTPMQALTLLNDEAYIEMARSLAHRVVQTDLADDRDRLVRAFQWCVARSPDAEEIAILQALLVDQRQAIQKDPRQALELVGQSTEETEQAILDETIISEDTQELAAWVCVANTLLNLDETINKE